MASIKTGNRDMQDLRCKSCISKTLFDDLSQALDTLARQTGSRIVPSGAVAANRLELSNQVPAKPVYLTDGRTRQVRIGVRHSSFGTRPLKNSRWDAARVRWCFRHCGILGTRLQTIRWLPNSDKPCYRSSGRNSFATCGTRRLALRPSCAKSFRMKTRLLPSPPPG
jgi:hypothetical protein